ncbi:putative Amidase [Trypanosoma vivax]|uniref:Amidase domain-containing protein n=1 Tax=Trypanosoma vivax (strain Y486) TaxID=1055687 RepID=G0U1A1_TRYVY|nr:putative Amidase [Trypanosoma vivax]CCC49856.1 conserved hypothetical protein [Trypanosoma vivax Y486]
MLKAVLFFLLSLAAYAAWWYGGVLVLVTLLIVCTYAVDRLFESYLRAGPRTSRQVPPTPVARCQQLSALQLSEAYRTGKLSCEVVVRTYIEHIKRVNPYINALVYECFDEAVASAIEADRIWAAWRANKKRPEPSWLLGVPCTIKECMQVKGCPNSSGLPQRRGVLSLGDSPVVKNFRDAGAIILGVTNTSELCMWYESSNYVYGISCNPYDTCRIVGGSSGGEGACAAAAFSTFSLGSDIGGSIRMPAFFNGVFGHKSSPHYISNRGQHPSPRSSSHHYMTTGPISRFAEDLAPLCEVAARGGFREDPVKFPPRPPLRKIPHLVKGKRLRVYVLEDFGARNVRTSEDQLATTRAVARCLEREFGAEVTYVNLYDKRRCTDGRVPDEFRPFSQSFLLWSSTLMSDKSEVQFVTMIRDGLPNFNTFAELCRWLVGRSEHTMPALCLCMLELLQQYSPVSVFPVTDGSILEHFKENLEALLGDDAVIVAPTFPKPAPRHHSPLLSPFDFQYTAIFNVLRMPSTAVPIWPEELRGTRKVLTVEEVREHGHHSHAHLPKGVQVVSSELNDELSISVALALERSLGGYKYPGWAVLE